MRSGDRRLVSQIRLLKAHRCILDEDLIVCLLDVRRLPPTHTETQIFLINLRPKKKEKEKGQWKYNLLWDSISVLFPLSFSSQIIELAPLLG